MAYIFLLCFLLDEWFNRQVSQPFLGSQMGRTQVKALPSATSNASMVCLVLNLHP